VRRPIALLLTLAVACSSDDGEPAEPAGDAPAEAMRSDQPAAAPAEQQEAPEVDVVSQPEPRVPDVPFVAECERPRPVAEGRLIVERDLVYSRAGGEDITLDLLRPRTDELRPAVLLIHGGGWRRGEKAHVDSMARALAGEGLVGVALDFRLADAPRVTFPGPIADARCAVRWLRAHGAEHGVDPDRIGAVGFSSGGHMAAMLATAADVQGLDEPGCLAPDDVSPAIQAASPWFAPLDLSQRVGRQDSGPHIRNLLGGRRAELPEKVALASPVTHVDAADAPVLLVHGTEDPTVGLHQSHALRDAMREAGAPVFYAELEGAGHGFGLLSRHPENLPGICTTMEFLRRLLAPDPAR